MLVVTRKSGERLFLLCRGVPIWITINDANCGTASVGIDAKKDDVTILREEVLERERERKRVSATGA